MLSQVLQDDILIDIAREIAEMSGYIVSEAKSSIVVNEGGESPLEHAQGRPNGSPEGGPGWGRALTVVNLAAEAAGTGVARMTLLVRRARGAGIAEEAGRVVRELVLAIHSDLFLALRFRREPLQKVQRNGVVETVLLHSL